MRIEVGYLARNPVRSPICEVRFTVRRHARRHRLDVHRGLPERRRARGAWALRLGARGSAADTGTYYLSPLLRDHSGVHVLDRHERWVRVQVREGRYLEREGCVVLPGNWALDRDG